MFANNKLLVVFCFLIVVLGFSFLWFGLKPPEVVESAPSAPPEVVESDQITNSVVGIEGERALVTKVVDGDTIVVGDKDTIRLIGIDTPETVDPRRSVGCFGKEASNQMKNLLNGKVVVLDKDVSDTDKYSRLLRYVYLPLENGQTLFVNDYLVREGFAKVLTYPPDVKFNEQLREAERYARENSNGLWSKCR